MLRRTIWSLTGIFWGICVFLTHARFPEGPPGVPPDKVLHYLGYGALAGAWYLSALVWKPKWRWIWLAVLILGMSYGALDEITQPPFGRTCDFYDWLADLAGTVTAVVGMTVIVAGVRHVGAQRREESLPALAGA